MQIETLDFTKLKSLDKLRESVNEKEKMFPNLSAEMQDILNEAYEWYYKTVSIEKGVM